MSPEEFRRGFRSHSSKLADARRLVELPGATVVYDEERVGSLRDLRDAALYVTVGDDYAAVTPNSQITPEQATDAVRFVKEMESYTEKMEAFTERIGLKALTK